MRAAHRSRFRHDYVNIFFVIFEGFIKKHSVSVLAQNDAQKPLQIAHNRRIRALLFPLSHQSSAKSATDTPALRQKS